jgi:hypothetical protein
MNCRGRHASLSILRSGGPSITLVGWGAAERCIGTELRAEIGRNKKTPRRTSRRGESAQAQHTFSPHGAGNVFDREFQEITFFLRPAFDIDYL